MQNPDTLLTPADLARMLCVSTRTIRRLRAQGRISCISVTPMRPRFNFIQVLAELHGKKEGSEIIQADADKFISAGADGSDCSQTEVLA